MVGPEILFPVSYKNMFSPIFTLGFSLTSVQTEVNLFIYTHTCPNPHSHKSTFTPTPPCSSTPTISHFHYLVLGVTRLGQGLGAQCQDKVIV